MEYTIDDVKRWIDEMCEADDLRTYMDETGRNARPNKGISIPRASEILKAGDQAEFNLMKIGLVDEHGNVNDNPTDPILQEASQYFTDNYC